MRSPSVELHNEYINSMVSRLESDPTASDSEPPKKRAREVQPASDIVSALSCSVTAVVLPHLFLLVLSSTWRISREIS